MPEGQDGRSGVDRPRDRGQGACLATCGLATLQHRYGKTCRTKTDRGREATHSGTDDDRFAFAAFHAASLARDGRLSNLDYSVV